MIETKHSIWDGCTNLYSLQKTLRFDYKRKMSPETQVKKDKGKDKKTRDQFSVIQKIIRHDIHKKFFEDTPEDVLLGKKIPN